ncbi:MAG: FtsX-like permease family protein [Bacteroidetes bacterium]|nr:FtsX-like permease family protein [Bacteroidota bacterium]
MKLLCNKTKIKEVSIRKVLGATDKQLIYQLSIGFVLMLLVAVVVSVPLAWLLNSLWLEQIAYRVTIDFGVISFGVLILLIFGIITIGSQTYRASTVSPVDNLRNE